MSKAKERKRQNRDESIVCQPIKDVDQVNKLLSCPDARDRMFLTLGVYTAYRVSTLINMKWKHVLNTTNRKPLPFIERYITKQDTHRKAKVTKTLNIELSSYYKHCGEPGLESYLFFGRRGPASRTGHISDTAARDIVSKWCRHFNIDTPWPSCHTLRKTYAYHYYINNNCELSLVMQMLGHKSEAHTLRYIGVTEESVMVGSKDFYADPQKPLKTMIEVGDIDVIQLLNGILATTSQDELIRTYLFKLFRTYTQNDTDIANTINTMYSMGTVAMAKKLNGYGNIGN